MEKELSIPAQQSDMPVVRSFWHGQELGHYQLLCLASFVANGCRAELFRYDQNLNAPSWIELRDAREFIPDRTVMHYQVGFGRGSPALHSNLFRYAMLHELGGWWIDCDMLMLRPNLPQETFFMAYQQNDLCGNSILRFPAGHTLLATAKNVCEQIGEAAFWGQTGPYLLTRLLQDHDLMSKVLPVIAAYPIPWTDVGIFFDPDRTDEVVERCRESLAVHLFNEVWRGSGIPSWLGPPTGSFLDRMFEKFGLNPKFADRVRYPELERWVTNRNKAIIAQLEVDRTRAEHDRLLAQIEALKTSTSWKITRPARKLVELIRGRG